MHLYSQLEDMKQGRSCQDRSQIQPQMAHQVGSEGEGKRRALAKLIWGEESGGRDTRMTISLGLNDIWIP